MRMMRVEEYDDDEAGQFESQMGMGWVGPGRDDDERTVEMMRGRGRWLTSQDETVTGQDTR